MYRVNIRKGDCIVIRCTNSPTLAKRMIERARENHHLVSWVALRGAVPLDKVGDPTFVITPEFVGV